MKAASPMELPISPRAKAIADGLIRTDRAGKHGIYDQGMLRLERRGGGFYWIALNGSRVLRGNALFNADELQPNFTEAMAEAGAHDHLPTPWARGARWATSGLIR